MAHKQFVVMILFMMSAVLLLPAQTQMQVTDSLRGEGYSVTNPRADGGRPTWDVRYGQGVPFTLSMIGPLNEARSTALEVIRDRVFELEGLDVRRARVVFDEDRATVIIIPQAYVIEGRDYSDYMPSGMQFVFDEALAFDFRMLSDNLALRINGQFLTEEQFRERIVRAIDNPAAYIESTDPLFLARRLEEQQSLLDSIRATVIRREEALLEEIRENVRVGEQALSFQVRRAEAAEQALREDLEREIADLTERHEQLLANHEALLAGTESLRREFETLREGVIALTGRRLFGSLRELDPGAIMRVVELRRADPALTEDEARDRVNEELGEEVPPLHSRHVQAIYAVYFNDYDQ